MRHCTICGAAAREGAKFCTSCGARLPMDEVSAPTPAAETATATTIAGEPADATTAAETDTAATASDQPAQGSESTATSARPAEYVASWPDASDTDETASEPAASGTVTAPAPEHVATDADQEPAPTSERASSWVQGQTSSEPRETAPSSFATDADQDPEPSRSTTSWSWSAFGKSTDETVSAEAPEAFATDADQDVDRSRTAATSWSWGASSTLAEQEPASDVATDADQDAALTETGSETSQEAAATDASDEATTEETTTEAAVESAMADVEAAEPLAAATQDDEADHHGASQWESWAPVAAGESTVATSSSEAARSVRGLLHELANRIDRLVTPATMASREVDPDELADQLGKWSRAVPGTDGLLEVVQIVRKSPRDIDALVALADRAPDLELLVRHYQSITASSERWAGELRTPREQSADESTAW